MCSCEKGLALVSSSQGVFLFFPERRKDVHPAFSTFLCRSSFLSLVVSFSSFLCSSWRVMLEGWLLSSFSAESSCLESIYLSVSLCVCLSLSLSSRSVHSSVFAPATHGVSLHLSFFPFSFVTGFMRRFFPLSPSKVVCART